MAFYDRLKEARVNSGFTQEQLAERLGIAKSTLSGYESGNREPTVATIAKAIEILGIDANFLYQDEMDALGGNPMQLKYNEMEHIKKYRDLDADGQSHVDAVLQWEMARLTALSELERRQSIIVELGGHQSISKRYIQYFQKVSAGTGEVIYEDTPPERISIPDVPEYRRVAYAVTVSGRSMEPLYNDGDLLLIEPTCIVDVGEIGIFNVNGKAFVKKRGEMELISLNEEHGNIPLANEARCMGRVVDKYVAD